MAVEGTNTILGLNVSFPAGGEAVGESDNHHRQTKTVLKYIFQGPTGNGFSTPITCSEAEINFLTGVTSAIQSQLNAHTSDISARIKKDGSEDFTGTVGSSAARAADTDFCRAQDYAATTIGGTLKARWDSGSSTLYLSNTAVDP